MVATSWTVVSISQAGYLNMAGADHSLAGSPGATLRLGKSGFDIPSQVRNPSARSPIIWQSRKLPASSMHRGKADLRTPAAPISSSRSRKEQPAASPTHCHKASE